MLYSLIKTVVQFNVLQFLRGGYYVQNNRMRDILMSITNEDNPVEGYIPNTSDERLTINCSKVDSVILDGDGNLTVVPKAKKVKKPKSKYKSAISEDNIEYSIDEVRLRVMYYVEDVREYEYVEGSKYLKCKKNGINTVMSILKNEPYVAFAKGRKQEVDKSEVFGWDVDGIFNRERIDNYKCDYWTDNRCSSYRHNFSVKDLNKNGNRCSIQLFVEHNSLKKNINGKYSKVDVVLKYNPNKCEGSFVLNYLLDTIYRDNEDVQVLSYDLAIDLYNVNINDVVLIKDKRGMRTFDNGGDDKTLYLGQRSSNGAIKVYNKAKEQKLLENVNWTRYEVTVKPENFDACVIAKELYRIDEGLFADLLYTNSFDEKSTGLEGVDSFLLKMCLKYPQELNELKKSSRSKFKKIEQLLKSNYSVMFDFDKINFVVSDFFKTIYTI